MKKKVLSRTLAVALSLAMTASCMASFSIVAQAADAIPKPIMVYDFSHSIEELQTLDEAIEVVENAAAPTIVEDEKMGTVLKLGKAVNTESQVLGEGSAIVLDDSEYSTINITNPYKGMKDELVEYDNYEDVPTRKYRKSFQPLWTTGITISYWIKTNGLNSNILGFKNDKFLIQADDYAKYLCTVAFDKDYNEYTPEEKEALGPSVVYSGVSQNSDFYFAYYNDDDTYMTFNGVTGPVYLPASDLGRTYWMNKFYVPGNCRVSDYEYTLSTSDQGNYADSYLAPNFGSDYDAVKAAYEEFNREYYTAFYSDEASEIKAGKMLAARDKLLADLKAAGVSDNGSKHRFAWVEAEMWLDASSSFYFMADDNYDLQINPNHGASYLTMVGMHNGNVFNVNSWNSGHARLEEAIAAGDAADSPVSVNPDDWHYVTVVIQNDWVEYYFDGEFIDVEEKYSSFAGTGLATKTGNYKPWKRFNKGTGSRYGYGSDKDKTYWGAYGNFVTDTIMQWITDETTTLTIGGGNTNGDGYNMFADTDEVEIRNIVFYDKMLDKDQIELLADKPDYYKNWGFETDASGDVDGNDVVDANDALAVLKHAAQIEDIDDAYIAEADVDGNGVVDANDALGILKMAAQLISDYSELQ